MESKIFFWHEFTKGLWLRIVLFAFVGMGWDVLMSTLQQLLGGKLNIHAVSPASAWMFFAYGLLPIFIYPLNFWACRFKMPYLLKVACFLFLFYGMEYLLGTILRAVGIIAWDYAWNLDRKWTGNGLITWHPVFIAAWTFFVMSADRIDYLVRECYGEFKFILKKTGRGG